MLLIIAIVALRVWRARSGSDHHIYHEEPSRRWGSHQENWDAQDHEGEALAPQAQEQSVWNDSEIEWGKRSPKQLRWRVHRYHNRNISTSEVARQVVEQEAVRLQPFKKRTWQR